MIKIEISARALFLLLLAPVLLWTAIQLWSVILLVLISLILMIGLLPYVEALVRRGIGRGFAVLALIITIIGVIILLFSLMVPPLVDEVTAVRENLPESAREVEKLLAKVGITVELQERARDIDWNNLISGRAAVDYGQRLLSITLSVITVLAITAYLLADTPRLARFIGQIIPPQQTDDANRLFISLTQVVGGYLRGQLITSLSIGVFTFIVLRIVGVANPLAFAVLAAFADVVPLIGAFIAIIPPVAAALQESSTKAFAALVLLLAYQQFEDRLLVPTLYGRTLNLPPIIVLIAVLAGAELLGVVGALLALPLTAAARVGLDYAFANGRLGQTQVSGDQPLAPDMPAPSSSPGGPARRRRMQIRVLRPRSRRGST